MFKQHASDVLALQPPRLATGPAEQFIDRGEYAADAPLRLPMGPAGEGLGGPTLRRKCRDRHCVRLINDSILRRRMRHEAAAIADRLRPLVRPGTAAYHVLAALAATRTNAEYAATATLLVRLLATEGEDVGGRR